MNPRGDYVCQCNEGFMGDGYKCGTETCDVLNNCGENAQCLPDSASLKYKCACISGYIGNGYQCHKDRN